MAAGKVLLAGGLLAGHFGAAFVQRRRYPFLLMGWLWFFGTLVPVIGLVQVGDQAMADRYTYIPSLGVLILAVWGAHELTRALAAPCDCVVGGGFSGDRPLPGVDAATARVLEGQ